MEKTMRWQEGEEGRRENGEGEKRKKVEWGR